MSSCTNSSNIQSNLISQVIREESSSKRVVFTINSTDAGISSGVTVGSVIRYDVPSSSYVPSIANSPASSEVIGVVEGIKISGSSTLYTVVASGLIKYPNIGSVINSYGEGAIPSNSGTGGEAGGADIFFLSDYAAGKMQLLEPSEPGHIVKPVMQKIAIGEYNAIVLNYIGYEVSDLASTEYFFAFPVGQIVYLNEDNIPPSNLEEFVDVSEQRLLSVTEYSDLYSMFGTQYGLYEETISLRSPTNTNLNLVVNSIAVQRDVFGTQLNGGTIVSANQSANTITIRKESTQEKTDLTKNIVIENSYGQINLVPLSYTITSFTVPSVPKQTINYSASTGSRTIQQKPYMKSKKDFTFVSIPNVVQLLKLTCDSIITQGITVGDKLANLEARLQLIEKKLG